MSLRGLLAVLGISILIPCASHGACTYLKDDGQVSKGIDFSQENTQKKEAQFVDSTGVQRKAVVRDYFANDSREVFDILLYGASGSVARIVMPVTGTIGKVKTVHIHPGYDSIFISNRVRMNGGGSERLTLIDPTTCKQVGEGIDLDEFPFADFDEIKDPKYAKEKAYFVKEAIDEGIPTKALVIKESANPKWAERLWMLNNESLLKGDIKGRLKLQWYSDEKVCTAEDQNEGGKLHYKNFKLFGGPLHKGASTFLSRTVKICDANKHQWAMFFVGARHKNNIVSLMLQGSNATVTTGLTGNVNINLENWEWNKSQ